MAVVTVSDVFRAAELKPCGPVAWKAPVTETRPGVYVVALTKSPVAKGRRFTSDAVLSQRHKAIAQRWQPGQPVLYIGRTKGPLRKRLRQFYKHRFGDPRPHCGGQSVVALKCKIWVHWAATDSPYEAEDRMIEHFRRVVGELPYANRVKAAQPKALVGVVGKSKSTPSRSRRGAQR
jgi:hypothetical protein